LAAGLCALLLSLFFLPARDPSIHRLTIDWRPSTVLAGLLFLLAVLAVIHPRAVAARALPRVLAALVLVAALLNLADAATPAILGRGLDLYWDLGHAHSLIGLAVDAIGPWRSAAAVLALAVCIALMVVVAQRLWRIVLAGLADRRVALAAAIVLGLGLTAAAWTPASVEPLASGPGRALVRQASGLERLWRPPAMLPAALAKPEPPKSDLAGLKGRDVYLVYLESYGTAVFDTPTFRAALEGPLARFQTVVEAAGYSIASNRLVSPTFGGGSWLAHATVASGVRVGDPVLYAALMASGRKLMPRYFKEAGWRALDIMPGIKGRYPEGRAWGFDRQVFADDLGYHGPGFGWFRIPDQFTLERAGTMRRALGEETPVFTQIVLVSSHIPFSPVPPYVSDWGDAGVFATVPRTGWDEVYRQPEWTRLAPAYAKSLAYDFVVLRDWLARRLSGRGLVILLGDHQPPAVVAGEDQPWTVPIHILSRDPTLVAPFLAAGYVRGLDPTQAAPHPGMEDFLAGFLAAFDRGG
jgi:hypothetical protein